MDYGKKNEKTWKMRHTHCTTWNMARNSKKKSEKWEKHNVGSGVWL